jgi:hypothetical protein
VSQLKTRYVTVSRLSSIWNVGRSDKWQRCKCLKGRRPAELAVRINSTHQMYVQLYDRWLCPHVFMLSHLQSIPGPRTSRSNSALQRHNSNEFTFTTCQLCGASFAKLSQAEVDQHNLACTSQLELRSNFKEIDVALKPVSFYPNHVMWDESLTWLYK